MPPKFINVSPESILHLEQITKTYASGHRRYDVLQGIDLDIVKGELVAIVGPSGCGKSTLLHIMGLLDAPSTGNITINIKTPSKTSSKCVSPEYTHSTCHLLSKGTPLEKYVSSKYTSKSSDIKKTMIRRHHIGFIFQFHHLLPEFSALENLVIPQLISRVDRQLAEERAVELLNVVEMKKKAHTLVTELSGGEQQRIAVVRAFAMNPVLVLGDEPTGNLDAKNSAIVMNLFLQQIKEHNAAAAIVTHNMELACMANRVLTIKNGVLC